MVVRTGHIAIIYHPDMKRSNSNDPRYSKKLGADARNIHFWRRGIQQNPVHTARYFSMMGVHDTQFTNILAGFRGLCW